MDDKIYNKVITIESKEETKTSNGNTVIKLKDHAGEHFSFFKKKKDEAGDLTILSSPATQFKNMGLDEGSTVKIGYVIKTYQDKQGVTRESKNIINFQETNNEPSQGSQTSEKPRGEAPTRSQSNSNRDFDKEAVGKCQSLFLQAYIQAGHTFGEAKLQVTQAKKLAEMVVYGHSETVATDIQEGAEQMAQEEDVDVDDIPW